MSVIYTGINQYLTKTVSLFAYQLSTTADLDILLFKHLVHYQLFVLCDRAILTTSQIPILPHLLPAITNILLSMGWIVNENIRFGVTFEAWCSCIDKDVIFFSYLEGGDVFNKNQKIILLPIETIWNKLKPIHHFD